MCYFVTIKVVDSVIKKKITPKVKCLTCVRYSGYSSS